MAKLEEWYCSTCKFHNDILSTQCFCYFETCQSYRPPPLARFAGWIEFRRSGYIVDLLYEQPIDGGRRKVNFNEDQLKELHARFFNNEATEIVPNMELEQLSAHIQELEMIAFEAKTRLQAATQNKRERVAKLRLAEREKLISNPDISGSDAITAVGKRKERLSKADKLKQTLGALGISTDDMKSIMGNIKIDESKIAPKVATELATKTAADIQNANLKEAISVVADKVEEKKEEANEDSPKPKLGFFKF